MPTCVKPRSPAACSGPPAVNHEQRHDETRAMWAAVTGCAPSRRAKERGQRKEGGADERPFRHQCSTDMSQFGRCRKLVCSISAAYSSASQ
jgi:hypothetical protein